MFMDFEIVEDLLSRLIACDTSNLIFDAHGNKGMVVV